ncbi:MAG: transglutaminase domain-containing protein [Lentisphaerae bacterium]|nr:transglutaminase domain-containing protein [Lentisphaerota bacterium]
MKSAPFRKDDLRLRLLAALMLMLSALFLGLLSDLPHAPLLVSVILLPCLFMSRPLPVNDRSVTYSILAVLCASVMLGYFFPTERGRLGFFSYFFKPEYYAVGSLSLAAISLYFPAASLIAAAVISSSVFVLGSCGDVSNLNYVNLRFIWGSDWINTHYQLAYAGMIALQLVLALYLLRLSLPRPQNEKKQALASILSILSLLLLCISIALFLFLHKKHEKSLRNLENSFIAVGSQHFFRQFIRHVEPFFSDQVDLNLPFPFGNPKNERRILLRVFSSQAPGYLRARVFTHYENGRWRGRETPGGLPLQTEMAEGLLAMSSYAREDAEAENNSVFDVFFSAALHLDKLPMPMPFAKIELVADLLQVDQDGQAQAEKWKREAGYRVSGSSNWRAGQPFDLPSGVNLKDSDYLQVPENLAQPLEQWLHSLEPPKQEHNDFERCSALSTYLQNNYTYRLGPFSQENDLPELGSGASFVRRRWHMGQKKRRQSLSYRRRLIPSQDDPVLHFLKQSKAGHCELFASALTLLLRQQGVPARYVTGFVCAEKHPSAAYYISRLGHAHAWVEAYDRQQQKWLLLDPTPPAGLRGYQYDWTWLQAKLELAGSLLTRILAAVQRGLIGEALGRSLKLLFQMLCSPPGIIGASLLLLLGLRCWRQKNALATAYLSPRQKQSSAEYKKLRRKWEKLLGLPKDPAGTARELLQAAQKKPNLPQKELESLKEKIQIYEAERFQKPS